jgi:predicted DNA-binding transcriptional regulator YafY
MRRADRLFQIIQHLRSGKLTTARRMAELCEVSERTVYRDIADLVANGVPIDGEAGVGYVLRHGFDIPPLMFTESEIVALVMGARLVAAWGGPGHARGAKAAMAKIDAVLPERIRKRAANVAIHAFPTRGDAAERAALDLVSEAIDSRHRLAIRYRSLQDQASSRTVRPLGLFYWGKVWTLTAWCELRVDFRSFRIDRIEAVEQGEPFADEAGRTLADYFRNAVGIDPP